MRILKILGVTLVLFISGVGQSSGNTNWPPIGAKWWYSAHCIITQYCGYYLLEVKRDTMLAGQNARVTEITRYHVSGVSSAGSIIMYSDADRVYMYDTINQSFFTLYDFSLKAGDTLTIQDTSLYRGFASHNDMAALFSVVVDSTGQTEISGQKLRTLYTSPVTDSSSIENTTDWQFRGKIKEQVGAIGRNPSLWGDLSVMMPGGWPGSFRCYEDDDITFKPFPLDCDYMDVNSGSIEI